MHVSAHTLVEWESEDYPQTVCIRPEMHEEHCVYAKSRQAVTCLHGVVFRDAGSPWVSSLPMCVTGFWCPRSFVVGVLCVDPGCTAVCMSGLVVRSSFTCSLPISASCGVGVLGVFAPSPRSLGVL